MVQIATLLLAGPLGYYRGDRRPGLGIYLLVAAVLLAIQTAWINSDSPDERAARDARAHMEVATDRARISAELDELLQRRLGELAPTGVELSAYRIVEHLLAALADAPDVDVRVHFTDDALQLSVSGPARRGAKAAIDRARERAQLHNGTLQASTRGGRADAVACLPVLTAA